jgi:hypothetical protein
MALRIKKKSYLLVCIVTFCLAFYQLSKSSAPKKQAIEHKSRKLKIQNNSAFKPEVEFDLSNDYLILFHMQKTSGTHWDTEMMKKLLVVGRNETKQRHACSSQKIAQEARIGSGGAKGQKVTIISFLYECRRRRRLVIDGGSESKNESWIVTWHERHWGWPCGLHPPLSDLRRCVMEKTTMAAGVAVTEDNFKFITILREPLKRFISEWNHVRLTGVVWVYDKARSESQLCLRSEFWLKININF